MGVPLLGLPPLAEAAARTEAEENGGGSQARNISWLDAHPLHDWHSRHARGRRLALCLWGIAGVAHGTSRDLKLDAGSIFMSADTHVRHMLR